LIAVLHDTWSNVISGIDSSYWAYAFVLVVMAYNFVEEVILKPSNIYWLILVSLSVTSAREHVRSRASRERPELFKREFSED
jgi:hypothetical protein